MFWEETGEWYTFPSSDKERGEEEKERMQKSFDGYHQILVERYKRVYSISYRNYENWRRLACLPIFAISRIDII